MTSALKPESEAEQLRRRNRELSILNAIAEALDREVDLARAAGRAGRAGLGTATYVRRMPRHCARYLWHEIGDLH